MTQKIPEEKKPKQNKKLLILGLCKGHSTSEFTYA